MPLIAYEVLGIIGRLLIKLETQFKDGKIDENELRDLITSFVMDLLQKYSD